MMAEDEQDQQKEPIISTRLMSDKTNGIPLIDDKKWSGIRMRDQSPLQGNNAIKLDWDLNDKNIEELKDLYPNDEVHFQNTSSNQESAPSQLLKIHQRFGHISFAKLQVMAKKEIIPKKYVTCDIPIGQACAYAKIIK